MNEARLHCCLSKLKKKKNLLCCVWFAADRVEVVAARKTRGGGLMLHKRIGHNRSLSNSENPPRALGAGPA